MKALIDFIPLIVFFILYKNTDKNNPNQPLLEFFGLTGGVSNNHILVATLGLVIVTALVYGGLFIYQKYRLEKQQWFVLLMTVVFGGLTLAFSDDYYIRLKAVLINLAFALGFLISPLFIKDKKPVVYKMFEPIFHLSNKGWQTLNFAWSGLFVLLAILHAFFAFVFKNGEYWGEFTAFGDMIVMLVFMVCMFIFLRKNLKADIK